MMLRRGLATSASLARGAARRPLPVKVGDLIEGFRVNAIDPVPPYDMHMLQVEMFVAECEPQRADVAPRWCMSGQVQSTSISIRPTPTIRSPSSFVHHQPQTMVSAS